MTKNDSRRVNLPRIMILISILLLSVFAISLVLSDVRLKLISYKPFDTLTSRITVSVSAGSSIIPPDSQSIQKSAQDYIDKQLNNRGKLFISSNCKKGVPIVEDVLYLFVLYPLNMLPNNVYPSLEIRIDISNDPAHEDLFNILMTSSIYEDVVIQREPTKVIYAAIRTDTTKRLLIKKEDVNQTIFEMMDVQLNNFQDIM